jgi:hypothetical protein
MEIHDRDDKCPNGYAAGVRASRPSTQTGTRERFTRRGVHLPAAVSIGTSTL